MPARGNALNRNARNSNTSSYNSYYNIENFSLARSVMTNFCSLCESLAISAEKSCIGQNFVKISDNN